MIRTLNSRSIALLAVLFSAAGVSFGSTTTRIVPTKGESLSFKRTYSKDHLTEAQPYQFLTKTKFVLKNTNGMITGTWSGTIWDRSRDERFEATAASICKARSSKHVECNFGGDVETANIYSRKDGMLVSIPLGHGVLFRSPEKDGMIRQEFLFGADDQNNAYLLKK